MRLILLAIAVAVSVPAMGQIMPWTPAGQGRPDAVRLESQIVDADQIKVIAFDVFGTVFNFDGVDRSQIGGYVKHVNDDEWSPLFVPESWAKMPAHDDAKEGIRLLRKKFTVVTLSNGPMRLLTKMSKNAGIDWDAIVPIEMAKVYKPKLDAYRTVMDLFHCHPSEVLMVTANPTFGDIDAARKLGMQSITIRESGLKQMRLTGPKTIIELAELLGCEE